MRFPPPLRIGIPLVLFLFGLFAGVISYFFEQREQQRSVEALATERMEFLGPKLAGMTAFLLEKNLPEGAQREISLTGTSPGLRHALVFDARWSSMRRMWCSLPRAANSAGWGSRIHWARVRRRSSSAPGGNRAHKSKSRRMAAVSWERFHFKWPLRGKPNRAEPEWCCSISTSAGKKPKCAPQTYAACKSSSSYCSR